MFVRMLKKIKKIFPSIDELADVMDPLHAGEALAPLPEVIPMEFTNFERKIDSRFVGLIS